MKPKDFETFWDMGKEMGDDVKGYTKLLITEMEKAKIPQPMIETAIQLFSEVDALIEWLSDEKLGKDAFEIWHKRRYLNHIHQNGKIYVPETEVNDC